MAGKKTNKVVATPTGSLPANDKATFRKIFNMICDDYHVIKPTEQLAANRMAAVVMHIKNCEELIAQHGMVIEDQNGEVKINPLSYFLNQLNSEFRSYVRLLRPKNLEVVVGPKNFLDVLAEASDEE